jgi:hypothetical protein
VAEKYIDDDILAHLKNTYSVAWGDTFFCNGNEELFFYDAYLEEPVHANRKSPFYPVRGCEEGRCHIHKLYWLEVEAFFWGGGIKQVER